jgi:hypothetical protein
VDQARDAAGLAELKHQLLAAIESLRRAIAELRMDSGQPAGVLTLGFVVGAGPIASSAPYESDQSTPLRTA